MKREDLEVGKTYQRIGDKGWTRTILFLTDIRVLYSYINCGDIGEDSCSVETFLEQFEPLREEYFQVFYHKKTAQRPACHAQLFKSKEDFLTRNDQDKEEFFHWIKLVKVEI